MKLELEDLTKDELILLIRKLPVFGPTQRDMLFVRWESLEKRAQRLSTEGSNAAQARDWGRAEKLWKEADSTWEKGRAVFAEGEKLCQKG
jgi:hypothetical protein